MTSSSGPYDEVRSLVGWALRRGGGEGRARARMVSSIQKCVSHGIFNGAREIRAGRKQPWPLIAAVLSERSEIDQFRDDFDRRVSGYTREKTVARVVGQDEKYLRVFSLEIWLVNVTTNSRNSIFTHVKITKTRKIPVKRYSDKVAGRKTVRN